MGSEGASPDHYEQEYFPDRVTWRNWLEENHALSRGIWVVFFKKSVGEPTLEYEESVEEALCFGWIDSRKKSLDGRRYMLMFTPRNPNSSWSRPNKERVKRLVEMELMAEAGVAIVEQAKRSGAWTVYDSIEDLLVPGDLADALAGASAQTKFESLTASARKRILWWVASARRPDTRARRIAKTAAAAAQSRSPL